MSCGLTIITLSSEKTSETASTESHVISDLISNYSKSDDVVTKRPSVPKKEVIYDGPSVVSKKGADPNSLTPSVYGRKGVSENDLNPKASTGKDTDGKQVLLTSSIAEDASLEKSESETNTAETKSDVSVGQEKGNVTTVPKLIQKEQSVDISPPDNRTRARNVSLAGTHSPKPVAAIDDLPKSDDENVSYAAVLLGLVVILAIAVSIVVGYRKLQDVWLRRHYAHVDYLIDGMYDA